MGALVWTLMNLATKVLSRKVTKGLTDTSWKAVTGRTPPVNPASSTTSWGEAVAFNAFSGALSAVAIMVVSRQAARFYQRSAGHLPKKLED